MRAHVFPADPDAKGRKWCNYCGALWHARMDATCLERADPNPSPRARPRSALDDNDALFGRLQELRAARDAIEAARAPPALVPAPDPDSAMDWNDCCI